MIIDQFQASLTGGAANAALRLHRALLERDVASRFWYSGKNESVSVDAACQPATWSRRGGNPWRFVTTAAKQVRRRLSLKREKIRYLRGRIPESELFTRPRLWRETHYGGAGAQADVIQLHWIARMIDYPSFFASIPDDFPIVWTLHDMNPLTGGCHYSEGCQAYTNHCGNCAMLPHRADDDLSNRSFELKRAALRNKNLHVVTPSRWLAAEARRSPILADAKSVQVIPNGLDTATFAPMDKGAAKRRLGLAQDRLVIGFGAESLVARRKGFHQFTAALQKLPRDCRVTGLAFGDGALPQLDNPRTELRSTGYMQNEASLAAVYSAADVFVLPSLEDNLPQTGVEAMACGTPVVGFDVGGIPDFVRPHQTGLLARKGDAADLARKLTWILEHREACRCMSQNAREMVCREFTASLQADRYIQLYSRLAQSQSHSPSTDSADPSRSQPSS